MLMNELFQLEHFSRDSFRVKRAYVDAAGDLVAGILLGQIVYWNLPNDEGKSKLKVIKDGEKWLAKGRSDWWDEIRITPKQFDRAIKILEAKNFVETKKFKFDGAPTVHIKLKTLELTQRVKSILTFGENPNSPKGNNDIDLSVNSLTEITTETTTKITSERDNVASAPVPALPIKEIIDYLNEKCGTRYKASSKKTQGLIKARFQEGFTLTDFTVVIDKKTAEWLTDKKMNQYLRPETLFGTKFEAYLNQKAVERVESNREHANLHELYNFD